MTKIHLQINEICFNSETSYNPSHVATATTDTASGSGASTSTSTAAAPAVVATAASDSADLNMPKTGCDLGQWPDRVPEQVKEYWISAGSASCQYKSADFSETQTTYPGERYARGFRLDHFSRKHKTDTHFDRY